MRATPLTTNILGKVQYRIQYRICDNILGKKSIGHVGKFQYVTHEYFQHLRTFYNSIPEQP